MPPSRGARMSGYRPKTLRQAQWPARKAAYYARARPAYRGFIRAFKRSPAYGVYKNWRMARRVRRARR